MFNQNHTNQNENEASQAKSSAPSQASSALPPSPSSSPAHEFSFTVSLRHHNCTASPSQFDLAPADDIFFHGHLLPLDKLQKGIETEPNDDYNNRNNVKSKRKASFSSLLGLAKWLRRGDDEEGKRKKKKKKKNKAFDLCCCWKKVCSLVFFGWEKEKRRRPCSISGKENDSREGSARWRWQGEFSAPTSMWASAAAASSDESTMVELQNAVQAAIAHCKNSIAVNEEKFS